MDRDVHAHNDMCVPNENLSLSFRVVVGLGSQVNAWGTDISPLLNGVGSENDGGPSDSVLPTSSTIVS